MHKNYHIRYVQIALPPRKLTCIPYIPWTANTPRTPSHEPFRLLEKQLMLVPIYVEPSFIDCLLPNDARLWWTVKSLSLVGLQTATSTLS